MRPPQSTESTARTHGFAAQPLEFLLRHHERHGDIFVAELRGVPTVFCGGTTGPAALFRAEPGRLEVHNTGLVRELFGRAVFNLRGEQHLRARQMLRAGLRGTRLREYAPDALGLANRHVARWAAPAGFDLYQAARAFTLAACVQIVLGISDEGGDGRAVAALFDTFVRGAGAPSRRRHTRTTYWRARLAAAELRAVFRRIESGHRARCGGVLSHLSAHAHADGDRGPLADLPDHLLALLVATRETTASLLTWLLAELAQRPATADAVAVEVQALAADPSLLVERVAAPTLRAVLLETERLHSPNTISVRSVTLDCHIGGYDVPGGWHAAYSPSANHLLPQLFTDPRGFRPDRFAGDRIGPAGHLLTFGGGVHACPGRGLAELLVMAAAAALFAGHRLVLHGGVVLPAPRYWPVKAPSAPIPAVLQGTGRGVG